MEQNKAGIKASLIGLVLNIMLGIIKLFAGIFSSSASIISDAANNISDSASSIVAVSAFSLAGRKADKEHPFGHGRYEYIAGLVIGICILLVGLEFITNGVRRIIEPQAVEVGIASAAILIFSILVKIFMIFFYRAFSKRAQSGTLKAAALDSFFDVLTTTVVLVSFIFSSKLPQRADGLCTIFVALFIIWGGLKTIIETVGKLLGNAADPSLVQKVYEAVLSNPAIIGAHDLYIHDYGINKKLGSVHAEFDQNMSISNAHKIIDEIEKDALANFGVELVIHVDPIDYSDSEKNKLRAQIKEVIEQYENLSIHELKLERDLKIIEFDIKLSNKLLCHRQEISQRIEQRLSSEFSDYELKIHYDILYYD